MRVRDRVLGGMGWGRVWRAPGLKGQSYGGQDLIIIVYNVGLRGLPPGTTNNTWTTISQPLRVCLMVLIITHGPLSHNPLRVCLMVLIITHGPLSHNLSGSASWY